MKRRFGTFCIIFGILLVACAAGLTYYNTRESEAAGEASAAVLEELERLIPVTAPSALPEAYQQVIPEMPTEEINGIPYVGTLLIPDLELELPIIADWSEARLQIAPCRYSGNYYADDMVIAGHNFYWHFSKLRTVPINTDVYFKNVEGSVFHYVVDNIETLQPTQTEDMVTGDWDLTLFTCTIGGATRCTVRCVKVED